MAQGTVIPSGLNLRETPGGTIIKGLPRGTIVEILEDLGDFLKVSTGGDVGFVAASFVSRQEGASGVPSGPELNLDALNGIVPAAVLAQIPETATKFGITTNLRLAHFLAQCALESTGFKDVEENLFYSAQGLLKTFKKYFKTVNPADYAKKPAKIANRVYANRMGNGDEASGDGFKYRGRGYIQLTGKNNYQSFSDFVGEDCVANPDLVATKYPLSSAAFYFSSNNVWAICDKGAGDDIVRRVSIAVNGDPPNHLTERTANFKKFMNALT